MSGRTPYGYRREPNTKLLVPDEVKAAVVRHVFELYAGGKHGTTTIARILEAEGAPAPRKEGWSPNALQLILANPAYRGLIRWNGSLHHGLHPPLVDEELFVKAQSILARRREDASLRRATQATTSSPDSSAATTAGVPTSAPPPTAALTATPTTPAPPATSTAPLGAPAIGSPKTDSRPPSSNSLPGSTATAD